MTTNRKPLLIAGLLLGLCAVAVIPALAWVESLSATVTVSTNATFTTAGTLSAGGGVAVGTLRRVVLSLPAGMTNVNARFVAYDGTVLLSTNALPGSASTATNHTLSAGAGVLPYVGLTIQTSGALYSTNTASTSLGLTITSDK